MILQMFLTWFDLGLTNRFSCHIGNCMTKQFKDKRQELVPLAPPQFSGLCGICWSVSCKKVSYGDAILWWIRAVHQNGSWQSMKTPGVHWRLNTCERTHIPMKVKGSNYPRYRKFFFHPNRFLICCHARWQFANSKCCIFPNKRHLATRYLKKLHIDKNSEDLVTLIFTLKTMYYVN